jgi:hypothetical protein
MKFGCEILLFVSIFLTGALAQDHPTTTLVDPVTLKQFDDNRVFHVDGRKCVGSELNGQRADSPDERKFLDANRVINPHPLRADRPLDWQLLDGASVYDGAGVLMGSVPSKLKLDDGRHVAVSKFNFGMSKQIDGKMCVYAFDVAVTPTPEARKVMDQDAITHDTIDTSAWLPLDQVVQKDELSQRVGLGKPGLPRLPLKDESYRITGGDPRQYATEFGELSIIANVSFGAVPSHYLKRPSGTVNLIYSVPGFGLGGQGVDSFLVSDGAIFHPAEGAKVFNQPTYYPKNHPRAGEKSEKTMTFIYGAVAIPGEQDVYGWIAKEALSD